MTKAQKVHHVAPIDTDRLLELMQEHATCGDEGCEILTLVAEIYALRVACRTTVQAQHEWGRRWPSRCPHGVRFPGASFCSVPGCEVQAAYGAGGMLQAAASRAPESGELEPVKRDAPAIQRALSVPVKGKPS